MVIALVLQLVGLIGLPVGGWFAADAGGAIVGASASLLYVGIAVDRGLG